MSDRDFIEAVIAARRESIAFFSNKGKRERELWIAREFLQNLGIDPSPSDLKSSDEDPPDVLYLSGRFEVKEILDPGKRRHAEYKESLKRALLAQHPSDLLEDCTPRDITYLEASELVAARALPSSGKHAVP